tara:strand:- start:606 stop:740 length:135 start_codon:yes stop_codon:yes gene_type:complete
MSPIKIALGETDAETEGDVATDGAESMPKKRIKENINFTGERII